MNKYLLIFILFSFISLNAQYYPNSLNKVTADDNNNYTTTGNIGITFTNYGVFGDGFREQSPTDQPSGEYPKGSGIEHIFAGGLWVGAQTNAGTKVTTGAFNSARINSAGSNNWEFTNTDIITDIILERSSIPDNNFYSPDAISHQDFIAEFSDTNLFLPGGGIQIPNHDPLGIAVHMETYAWNFPFADAFVIMNYTISNVGYGNNTSDTLRNVYVGLWADLVVRNVNILQSRVGSPFYQDIGVGYVNNPDTAKMVYAYEVDNGGFYTNTNSYVSMSLLGAETTAGDNSYNQEITHNWWLFSAGSEDWQNAPNSEAARYSRMTTSISDQDFVGIKGDGDNYLSLIATGPFEAINPGESINVVFAIACGKKHTNEPASTDNALMKRNLFENNGWAERAYHGEDSNRNGVLDYLGTDSTEDIIPNGILDRYILPTPPAPPKLKVIPENGKVTLLWDRTSENSIDLISKQKDFEGYRVYRSFLGNDLQGGVFDNMQRIKEYDNINNLFYDIGFDEIELTEPILEIKYNEQTGLNDTIEYAYRMDIDELHNGWQYAFAVTAFDSGNSQLNLPSLESTRLQNVSVVSPGTPATPSKTSFKVGVYPNPYKASAIWDGGRERERRLMFFNLPAQSEVRIYTLAGDQVDQFTHSSNYTGTDIDWYQKFSDPNIQTIFPGGEHAWDFITKNDQALATGLYLFTVKDMDTGKIHKGKFVIIK